jgi:hypothetical protein
MPLAQGFVAICLERIVLQHRVNARKLWWRRVIDRDLGGSLSYLSPCAAGQSHMTKLKHAFAAFAIRSVTKLRSLLLVRSLGALTLHTFLPYC